MGVVNNPFGRISIDIRCLGEKVRFLTGRGENAGFYRIRSCTFRHSGGATLNTGGS
jgi:hypothetical protein